VKEKEEKMHLPKITQDELDSFFFSTQKQREEEKLEKVQMISIEKIKNFKEHPYRIDDNQEMLDMAKTIKERGVIHPVIVRPKEDGTYEMISGHRRKRASELAELNEIPAIVRKMTDDEAIIYMVDSNKQRERVLPSEKAKAYKMRLDAMKRQGQRNDLTSVPMAQRLNGKTSRELLGEEMGESQDQIRRYIRLNELIPELLEFVDNDCLGVNPRIALRPAVEISYLKQEEQEILLDAIDTMVATPSHAQAIIMRKKSQENTLTSDDIYKIMEEEKPNQKESIKFKYENVKEYFPKGYSTEQMQNVMKKLLEEYRNRWKKKERDVR